jgi:cellobiose-specific phosphotransferase system component IIA
MYVRSRAILKTGAGTSLLTSSLAEASHRANVVLVHTADHPMNVPAFQLDVSKECSRMGIQM